MGENRKAIRKSADKQEATDHTEVSGVSPEKYLSSIIKHQVQNDNESSG